VSNFILAGVQRGLELLTSPIDLPIAFAPYDVLKNQPVMVLMDGKEEKGVAQGLHSNGCLLVEINGTLQQICQGGARVKRLSETV
jgi:biotin-(acetyl-CoA carboxylase) ligase